jgi:group I intron endonuclease
MTYIYTLSHPITKEVRYVGKTINIKRRYYDHLYRDGNTHKHHWVKSLLAEGLKPIMTIIEECPDNWEEREIFWITQFDNLTNLTKGGEKYEVTEELREKFRLLNTGNKNPNFGKKASKETKDKLSTVHKGKSIGNEQKNKVRNSLAGTKNECKPCMVNSITYCSATDAGRQLNIPSSTIYSRIKSSTYPMYQWI